MYLNKIFLNPIINMAEKIINDKFYPPKPAISRSASLDPGDILIKMSDDSGINKLISYGQLVTDTGAHMDWTHAGLTTSSTMIAEMSGDGLMHHSLVSENQKYTYDIFRCKYRQIALGAVAANQTLMEHSKKIKYSHGGAFRSLFPTLPDNNVGRMEKALNQMKVDTYSLFCSEHVVFCYQVALEANNASFIKHELCIQNLTVADVFDQEPDGYSPAYLHAVLQKSKSFDYVGRWNNMKWVI